MDLDSIIAAANARCAAAEEERYRVAQARVKFAFAHARRRYGQLLRSDRVRGSAGGRAQPWAITDLERQ